MAQILIIQNLTKSLQIEAGIKLQYLNLKSDVLKATTVKKSYADDWSSKLLWNVGIYLPDSTASHPRRQWAKSLLYVKSWVLQSLISVIFLRDLNELS